jgi:hypothetical protein
MDEEVGYRELTPDKLCRYLPPLPLQKERSLTRTNIPKRRLGKEEDGEVGDESREAELRRPSFRDGKGKELERLCHL